MGKIAIEKWSLEKCSGKKVELFFDRFSNGSGLVFENREVVLWIPITTRQIKWHTRHRLEHPGYTGLDHGF